MSPRLPRAIRWALWGGVALFAAIQLVPYGRDHANPPVTEQAAFTQGRGLRLVRDACFDCHSNETVWPWYTSVAPASWLVQRDVEEGRAALNFSEWDRPQPGAEDLLDVVVDGEMPPVTYTLVHPAARLDAAGRAALLDELRRMLASSPPLGDDDEPDGGR